MARKTGAKRPTRKPTGKKRSRKKSGRKRNSFAFISSIKQLFAWALIVAIGFVVLLFVYNHFYPDEYDKLQLPTVERSQSTTAERQTPPSKRSSTKEPGKTKESKRTTSASKPRGSINYPKDAELPRLKVKRKEQVIRHEGYTVSYNSDYRIANWVAWDLTAKEATSNKVERNNKFSIDPQVKGATAKNEDYTHTGFDRGHLAPAADMKWSGKAMTESFYMSNICPQHPRLNGGIWKELEEQSRLWAAEKDTILIVAGPVIEGEMRRLGKNRVGVPPAFYKVICSVSDGEYKGIGFIFENRDYKKTPLSSMVIPIDSVEKVTGIEFFYNLPKEDRTKMKRRVDLSSWSF